VPEGDALTFFTEPSDMRAAFPDEEGLGILKKRLVSYRYIRIPTTSKEVFHKALGISPDLTPNGVPCDFVALNKS
jgi:hypothetical protein